MDLPKPDVLTVIYELLPGFVMAWVYHGLTAHPKQTPFERTIHALIFTVIIKAVVVCLKWGLLRIGATWDEPWAWTPQSDLVWAVVLAFTLGLVFSSSVNSGIPHRLLPDWITKRTAYPSEWFQAFTERRRWVVLHLDDGRRIFGWPYLWPDSPSSGQFVIEVAHWQSSDDSESKDKGFHASGAEAIIIDVTRVRHVELLHERTVLKQEPNHGSQTSDTITSGDS